MQNMIAVRLTHTILPFQKLTVPFLTQLAGDVNWEKGFSLQFSCVENCSWVIRATLFSLQKSQPVKLLLWRLNPHFSYNSGKRCRQGNAPKRRAFLSSRDDETHVNSPCSSQLLGNNFSVPQSDVALPQYCLLLSLERNHCCLKKRKNYSSGAGKLASKVADSSPKSLQRSIAEMYLNIWQFELCPSGFKTTETSVYIHVEQFVLLKHHFQFWLTKK